MDQLPLEEFKPLRKLDLISKEELVNQYTALESRYFQALTEIQKLKNQNLTDTQIQLIMQEQLAVIRAEVFGPGTER